MDVPEPSDGLPGGTRTPDPQLRRPTRSVFITLGDPFRSVGDALDENGSSVNAVLKLV